MSDSTKERKKKNRAHKEQLKQRKNLAYRRRVGLGKDDEEIPLASALRRFLALAFDQILFGMFSLFFLFFLLMLIVPKESRVFGATTQTYTPPFFIFFVPSVVFGLIYIVPRITLRGQTFGRRRMRVLVINKDGTGLLNWNQSLTRWFCVYGAPATLCIVFSFISDNLTFQIVLAFLYFLWSFVVMLPAIWNPDRQGIHDRIAGSVVIVESSLINKMEK